MISDEQLEEWVSDSSNERSIPEMEFLDERVLELIQALRAERKCNAVLREGLSRLRKLTDDVPMMEILNMELRQIIAKEAEIRGEG